MTVGGAFAGTNDPAGGGYIKAAMLRIVKDGSILDDADHNQAVSAALGEYNKDKPRELVADIAGDGGYDYDLPDGWVEGSSAITSVEYPAGERDPVYLEPEDYLLYKSPTGTQLRFTGCTPATGESARVTYTVLHYDDTNIPLADTEAVASLAASYAYEWIANHYVKTKSSTMGADAVNYQTKSDEAGKRAKALRKIYEGHIGKGREMEVQAATGTKDFDPVYPGGMDRLTHPRRRF